MSELPNRYEHAPRLPGEGHEPVDLDALFEAEEGPIEIEIGPGRGSFGFERLEADPSVRYLGFEIRRKWATLVDQRLERLGHRPRARLFAEDARIALQRLSPPGSVTGFYVHFPDPWWKKRHQKRLVIGEMLLDEMVRLLKSGGYLYVATDVQDRAEQYDAAVAWVPELEPWGDEPGSSALSENPYRARSNREHRADEDELPVWRMRWRKTLEKAPASGENLAIGMQRENLSD